MSDFLFRLAIGGALGLGAKKLYDELRRDPRERARVFVSFDYDVDRRYRNLLSAWDANQGIDFVFNDASSREIQSKNVGVVKAALTRKIQSATHALFIVGAHCNDRHSDHRLIGFTNWINFEAARAKEAGLALVAVKLKKKFRLPSELRGAGATIVTGFNQQRIADAIRRS